MNKILSGSAVNYGSILPPLSKTTDGAMFYLVDTYTDPAGSPSNNTSAAIIRGAGLYTYVFSKDANTNVLGNQAGYMWVTVANMENFVKKLGDEMTGVLTMAGESWAGALHIKNKTPAINLTNTANIADHQELRMVYATVAGTNTGVFKVERRKNNDGDNNSASMVWLGDFLSIDTVGTIKSFGNTIWHSGSDGAGSGLDADKLDGQEGAFYLSTANHTGTTPVTRGGTGATSVNIGGVLFGASATAIASTAAGVAGQVLVSDGLNAPSWRNASTIASGSASALATPRQIELTSGVTGKILFDGSKDVQIVTTVASAPWSAIANIADYSKTIQKVGNTPYANIEMSARPSYFYTFAVSNTAVADMKPSHFPIQSITGFDAYNSDNQAVSAVSGNKMFRVGLTVRGEEIGGARSMQLAANWDYSEDTPFGGMFYRVNDDTHTVSEWGQWSQLVDAQYLKRYNQEIISTAAITSNLVKAWDQNPSHGYVAIVAAGEVANDPARYAGWIEYNARYPDNTEQRLGWIGCGKYDYDNSKKVVRDQGQIVYTAGQHYFVGKIDAASNVTALSLTARNQTLSSGASGGVTYTWDTYGSAAVASATSAGTTGGVSFFASYDSPDVRQRRAGYIGYSYVDRTQTTVQVGAKAAAPANDLGTIDYVAGHHHMFGNFYIHPDISYTAAIRDQVKMKVTAATGDIKTVGRLEVGDAALSGVVAQVTGNSKIIGNLEVTGTISGLIAAAGVQVTAANLGASAVTTPALADDSVTRAKVADEAIGSAQMGVNDLSNLCWNGKGDSLDGWSTAIANGIAVQTFSSWSSAIASPKAIVFRARDSYFGAMFNVVVGDKYFFQMDTYSPTVASLFRMAIGLELYDESGAAFWVVAAERPIGTAGQLSIEGFATIPKNAVKARVWVQLHDPAWAIAAGSGPYTANGQQHFATNISIRHATYATNSVSAEALATNGNGINIFSDYDFVEDYWNSKTNIYVAAPFDGSFTEPRVLKFADVVQTPVATSTYIASVEQPKSSLSRVFSGDELSLSYFARSSGDAAGNLTVVIRWYDATKTFVANASYATLALPLNTLTKKEMTIVVPANVSYAGVYVQRTSTGNGVSVQGWIDIGRIQLVKKFDASLISDVVQTSGNLLTNTETSNKEAYVGRGWSFGEGGLNGAGDDIVAIGVNGSHFVGADFAEWYPPYAEPFVIHQTGQSTAPNAYMDYTSASFPVIAGEYYEVSAYAQTHRAGAAVVLQFVNASGTALTTLSESFSVESSASIGNARQLSLWKRIGKIGIAPPTAAAARVILRKLNTHAGQSDSYAWFLFPYAGRANSSQTILSAYSAGNPFNPTGGLISASNKITTANAASIISAGAIGSNELANDITLSTLTVTGTATVGALVSNGDVTAFSTSDRSIKSNIEVIHNALDKIDAIRGVTFNRTDKEHEPREAGVIAQEVQAVLPEVVRMQDTGLLGVDYGKLVSLLIQGIKEQQVQIEMLKADIEDLKSSR